MRSGKRALGDAAATDGSKRKKPCLSKDAKAASGKHADATAAAALRSFFSIPEPETAMPVTAKKKKAKTPKQTGSAPASQPHGSRKAAPASSAARRPQVQPAHVEGVFHEDSLYLKDPTTGTVYSSTRDKAGNLVVVGTWDSATKAVCLSTPQELAELQPAKPEPAAAATPDAAPSPRFRPIVPPAFPFAPDPDDHCETSPDAYRDIKPLLLQLCQHLAKSPAALRIYDPYYCAGSVVRHLGNLGFESVYNKNEDFYEAIEQGSVPDHDVLLTNPPYSEDHMEKLLQFCKAHDKPWLLLVPSYVHQKPYFAQAFDGAARKPFFVVPRKRYNYWTPKNVSRDNPRVRKDGRTSPFVTLWHVNAQGLNTALLKWWQQKGYKKSPHVRVFKDTATMPVFVADDGDSRPRKFKGSKKH